ncbi:hypothetical protein ILYODFUR_028283 [Ilyodon furcidens]|uniref:E3 ubiquitin-protein ligase n=1 Tax=Ilyodon furcidens TaxID=33524 RepID=A0ABV0VI34_9TELE
MAECDRDPPSALCADFMNFSPKHTASRWLAAPDLQKEVYNHLATYVPRILCQGPCGGSGSREEQREELACQLLLLAPLEWLLLGDEPAAGVALLQENNQSSPLCGHVFKVGEPTYSCRECAADPTCVLCMQCFLASVHKHHRYRMTTSGGGGFCDCGDAEAWKTGPYCQKHTPADRNREAEEDPVSLLPPDMVARSYSIFSIILKYAVDLLTWDQEDQLPAGLEPPYVHQHIQRLNGVPLNRKLSCNQPNQNLRPRSTLVPLWPSRCFLLQSTHEMLCCWTVVRVLSPGQR